jgi:hypothetical protein
VTSFAYDEGSYGIQHQDVDYLTDTIKLMLVDNTYVPNRADTFATAAAKEINVSGYTPGFAGSGRKTLGSKSLTKDTTNHRTVYRAGDPTHGDLGAGVRIAGAVVYKHDTDDATSVALFFIGFTDQSTGNPYVDTNGGAFVFQFPSNIVGYTQE